MNGFPILRLENNFGCLKKLKQQQETFLFANDSCKKIVPRKKMKNVARRRKNLLNKENNIVYLLFLFKKSQQEMTNMK